MDTEDEALQLLDRAESLRCACDLDLLLFFARHPHAFLGSESLARLLGHDLNETAQSLETLLNAGLITRKQTLAHAARLYVFIAGPAHRDWLPSLLERASTRGGRLSLMQALARRREAPVRRLAVSRQQPDTVTSPQRPSASSAIGRRGERPSPGVAAGPHPVRT